MNNFQVAHDFYAAAAIAPAHHAEGAHRINEARDILTFITAGRAIFTLVSKTSGERRTFRIAAPKDAAPGDAMRFVSLLTGPDNTTNYEYVGLVTRVGDELVTRTSRGKLPTTPLNTIGWLLAQLQRAVRGEPSKLDQVEVWHEGRCCRCGRRLTVPSSIESGIGPECATKI